ncbi:MAG: hypothetical protein AABX52_00370 [Nanoarchaeota archaeon]
MAGSHQKHTLTKEPRTHDQSPLEEIVCFDEGKLTSIIDLYTPFGLSPSFEKTQDVYDRLNHLVSNLDEASQSSIISCSGVFSAAYRIMCEPAKKALYDKHYLNTSRERMKLIPQLDDLSELLGISLKDSTYVYAKSHLIDEVDKLSNSEPAFVDTARAYFHQKKDYVIKSAKVAGTLINYGVIATLSALYVCEKIAALPGFFGYGLQRGFPDYMSTENLSLRTLLGATIAAGVSSTLLYWCTRYPSAYSIGSLVFTNVAGGLYGDMVALHEQRLRLHKNTLEIKQRLLSDLESKSVLIELVNPEATKQLVTLLPKGTDDT